MSLFQYKARGQRGDAIEGLMEANSTDAVAAQLIESGLIPIDIGIATQGINKHISLESLFPTKVTASDIIQFSRQMHSLMKVGVPILTSLAGLSDATKNPTLKTAIREISVSLQAGHDLATALSDHPKIFSMFYVSLIRIGETSGQLDAIFLQLARYMERDEKTRKQIKSATRYPIFVLSAITVALFIINIWIVPKFAAFFAKYDATLPFLTRLLIGLSNIFSNYWYLIITFIIALVIGFKYYIESEKGMLWWGRRKLKLPIIGSVIYKATLARFARLFAMSSRAGVPLITAITVVSKALDNKFMEERILDMRAGIERGESISRTAMASGMFDTLVMQMMNVGEETGAIDELLQEVAEYYDLEVEYEIDRLSASIEPILTGVVGGIVLVLALGVLLPMFNLANVAMHK